MDILENNETAFFQLQNKMQEDALVDSLLFLRSNWHIPVILASYLYFSLKLGPDFMANRKPFNLKNVILAYNFVQVICNGYFLFWFSSQPNIFSYVAEQSCNPTEHKELQHRLFFVKAVWVWLLLKVSDLFDTVFFILRKKYSQVTFLHIYHHTSMVASVWLYTKLVFGEQAMLIGLINSFVHTIMYAYYFLTALGPEIQKYLWWKKYITKLQLVQFGVFTMYFTVLAVSCNLPAIQKAYNYYVVSQAVAFAFMFSRFYFKSYTKNKENLVSKKKKEESNGVQTNEVENKKNQ